MRDAPPVPERSHLGVADSPIRRVDLLHRYLGDPVPLPQGLVVEIRLELVPIQPALIEAHGALASERGVESLCHALLLSLGDLREHRERQYLARHALGLRKIA